jgi:hypothetical protein
MNKVDQSTPSNKFLKAISNPALSRSMASKISQLRLTHIPLNSYLHQFKRMDTANCPTCSEQVEDIVHFLLKCPAYAHKRWALSKAARKQQKPLTLETLLGNTDMAVPLANYIDATHRFKQTSEQTSTRNEDTMQEIAHR